MSITRFSLVFAVLFSILLGGDSAVLHGQSSTRAGGGVQYAAPSDADVGEESSKVFPVSWPKVTMPKITMPTITMPRWPKLWPSAEGGKDSSPALLAPVAAGARKITSGAKKAWEGTKDILSFSGNGKESNSKKQSRSKPQPSLWKRMFTPAEPTVPRTMGEWMSQSRLDP